MATFLELAPYYLVGPLLGLIAYTLAMETASSHGGAASVDMRIRKLLLVTLPAAPLVYAVVLLSLALPVQGGAQTSAILTQVGLSFSLAAFLACLGMAYQISRAIGALERHPVLFTRNMVLEVLPLTAPLFALVIGMIILGMLSGPGDVVLLTPGALATSLNWTYAIGAGGLVVGLLAGAATDPENPQEFVRRLLVVLPVDTFMVVSLSLALFSLP